VLCVAHHILASTAQSVVLEIMWRMIMDLQKVINLLEQEYERAQKMCWVHNPLAWALYRVWKKADGQKDWDEDCIRDCKNCWKTKLAVVHGRWISYHEADIGYDEYGVRCSSCGFEVEDHEVKFKMKYCPNCGAKMDGG